MNKIASAINCVPTKISFTMKEIPSGIARSIKQHFENNLKSQN